jgi:hypothetical protein
MTEVGSARVMIYEKDAFAIAAKMTKRGRPTDGATTVCNMDQVYPGESMAAEAIAETKLDGIPEYDQASPEVKSATVKALAATIIAKHKNEKGQLLSLYESLSWGAQNSYKSHCNFCYKDGKSWYNYLESCGPYPDFELNITNDDIKAALAEGNKAPAPAAKAPAPKAAGAPVITGMVPTWVTAGSNKPQIITISGNNLEQAKVSVTDEKCENAMNKPAYKGGKIKIKVTPSEFTAAQTCQITVKTEGVGEDTKELEVRRPQGEEKPAAAAKKSTGKASPCAGEVDKDDEKACNDKCGPLKENPTAFQKCVAKFL